LIPAFTSLHEQFSSRNRENDDTCSIYVGSKFGYEKCSLPTITSENVSNERVIAKQTNGEATIGSARLVKC